MSHQEKITLNVVQVWCHPGGNERMQTYFCYIMKINNMLHPVVDNLFLSERVSKKSGNK